MTSALHVRKTLVCVALAQAMSCTPAAWAQENPDHVALDRIVVIGARNTERDRGLLGEPILPSDAPVDIRSIPSAVLLAPGHTSLASVLSRDASVEENYATSGYYQNFMIRGFTLDLGSAYRINGFVVPGEFDIPLDNMESVQLLEGVAGLHGGMIAAGERSIS
jgi:iron complex outermembrane receptor protein